MQYATASYPDSGDIIARTVEAKLKTGIGPLTTGTGVPLRDRRRDG
jgi:hypothetical protein